MPWQDTADVHDPNNWSGALNPPGFHPPVPEFAPRTAMRHVGPEGRDPGQPTPMPKSEPCPAQWEAEILVTIPEAYRDLVRSSRIVLGTEFRGRGMSYPGTAKPLYIGGQWVLRFVFAGQELLMPGSDRRLPCEYFSAQPSNLQIIINDEFAKTDKVLSLKDLKRVRQPAEVPGGPQALDQYTKPICCGQVTQWQFLYEMPEVKLRNCLGSYEVALVVEWKGKQPPPLGLNAALDKNSPLTGSSGVDKSHAQRHQTGVGGRGAATYVWSGKALPGSHVLKVRASTLFNADVPVTKDWFGGKNFDSTQIKDGMIHIGFHVECDELTKKEVRIKVPSTAESGGGGAPPDQKPKKKPGEGVEEQPANFADQYFGGDAGAGYGEPYAAAESSGEGYAGSYSVPPTGQSDAERDGVASLDPMAGLRSVLEEATSSRTGGGGPWTLLDLLVDPSSSQDAGDGVRTGEIDGEHAVRGAFNGRFRGFIQGPPMRLR